MKANLTFPISLLALVMAACENDREKLDYSSSTEIRPTLASVTKTKGTVEEDSLGRRISTIPLSENSDDSLYLVIFERDMPESSRESIKTKGAEITSESLSSFKMKAFAEDNWQSNDGIECEAGEYFSTTAVSKTNGKWEMTMKRTWLNNVPITFWSWNEVEPVVSFQDGSENASFIYTTSDEVTSQKDLLFAYNRESRSFSSGKVTAMTSSNKRYTRTDEEMDIHFCHALSAIKFDISGVVGQNVDKITIGGVASSGHCQITADPNGDPAFYWSDYGEPMSYSQDFIPTDFKDNGQMIEGSDKEFLLIPQTLTDATTLTITFDGVTSKPKCIKGNDITWQPGKFYTYKITKSAYDYDYTFKLMWDDYTFSNNRDREGTASSNIINSYRVRSDDPTSKKEHVDWIIKSYQIGNGEEVEVNDVSLDYNPSWIKASVSAAGPAVDILTVKAKRADLISKGGNDYWLNKDGRTDDLAWSPADWSDKGIIDLSKMNVYVDDPGSSINAHAMTTSNCYIVRHAGTYMLPLVYGNGIKSGMENIPAYFSQTRPYDVGKLSRFLNHKDEGITSAYIENNQGCIANGCELLWESDAAVITNLELIGNVAPSGAVNMSNVRYLKFTVDRKDVAQSNALIAIKDSEGTVIWSWHIWITNDPNVTEQPIEVTNYVGNKYYFLNVDNIGAVTESTYLERPTIVLTLQQERSSGAPATLKITLNQNLFETERSSLMYEWGRKDPFLKYNFDYNGNDILTYKQENSTIGSGIREPLTWFGFQYLSNGKKREWVEPVYTNLWTGIKGDYNTIERDHETVKTIYDPSPVGYMVPPIGAFSGFDTRSGQHTDSPSQPECWNVVSTIFDDGYDFYTSLGPGHTVNTSGPTIRFHADGIRAGDGADFRAGRGWYLSSSHPEEKRVSFFDVESDCCTSNTVASPSNGYSIRPIRE